MANVYRLDGWNFKLLFFLLPQFFHQMAEINPFIVNTDHKRLLPSQLLCCLNFQITPEQTQ